jgi:hypothetical protein
MLQLFNRFGPPGVLLLYILNWLLKLKYVIYPEKLQSISNNKVFSYLRFPNFDSFGNSNTTLYVVVSLHVAFLSALLLNVFCIQEKLCAKTSMLPALCFVVISSMLPEGFLLQKNYWEVLLLFITFRYIFSTNVLTSANSRIWKAGFFMGCMVLSHPIFIVIALALLISIISFRGINFQSIGAYIVGLLFPAYLFFSILWLIKPSLLAKMQMFHFEIPKMVFHKEQLLLSIVGIVWHVIHIYFLKQNKNEIGGLQADKKWFTFRLAWVVLFFCSLSSSLLPNTILLSWLVVSSILVYPCFNTVLNKKWANFSFVFLILIVLFNQLVFN